MSNYYCIKLPNSEFKPCESRIARYGQKEYSCSYKNSCRHSGYIKLKVKDYANYMKTIEKLRANQELKTNG